MKNYKPSKEDVEEPKVEEKGLEAMLEIDEINPTDYIMFLKQDGSQFAVTINLEYCENNWYNQNKLAIRSGRIVSDINEAMIMYREVVDSHVNNKMLYYSNGNEVEKKVRDDLYKRLTQGNRQNLNAIFKNNKDKRLLLMKKAIGLDKKGELVYDSGINISNYVANGGLIGLEDFDENGLPKIVSNLKKFDRDKNIIFYNPKDFRVAHLFSDSDDGSNLDCDSNPDINNYSLGVRLSIGGKK